MTTFEARVAIVAEAWMTLRKVDKWSDVIAYGDVGFPLAYAAANDYISLTEEDEGSRLVNEVYFILLDTLGIEDSDSYTEFENLLDANIAKYNPEDE